jgi:hypothetical protein
VEKTALRISLKLQFLKYWRILTLDALDRMIYKAAQGMYLVNLDGQWYAADRGGRVKLSPVVVGALMARGEL